MSAHLKIAVTDADHARGSARAAVVLVQFGDYQCPYCRQAFPIVKRLQTELGESLRFVFRNFPLTQAHPDALNAALTAEAAALQDKFWEMHDLLYEKQENLDGESLLGYAAELKLDLATFRRDFAGATVRERIERDFDGGVRSGVNGTPAFYVNGIRYDGDWSHRVFLPVLAKAVEAAGK